MCLVCVRVLQYACMYTCMCLCLSAKIHGRTNTVLSRLFLGVLQSPIV